MYESPIDIITHNIEIQMENKIVRAVQKCDIHVDKDELVKALLYDRNQYVKGYKDGLAVLDVIRAELLAISEYDYIPTRNAMEIIDKYKIKSKGGEIDDNA